ncbi:MAG: 50S ribosomal protein L17 [Parcubacteria group bacterium CG10_big_fil_rev_8_21_14_0_10_36_14]|nr:MAG: 50S ribosomal protein L17 [Parcubacteria group bacterium CG10_big_fil_rev_8_21_14_0_10_36_14]
MRHHIKTKTLGRKKASREALFRSLATSLVLYEKIKTTEAKAKLLRSYVEKMITLGKKNTLHTRRQLLKKLYVESAVKKVLDDLSPRFSQRKGGYLRITKLGFRRGDAAKMVKIEFVESAKPKTETKEAKKPVKKSPKTKKATKTK